MYEELETAVVFEIVDVIAPRRAVGRVFAFRKVQACVLSELNLIEVELSK